MNQNMNDELYHHGVLGQKWGVRKDRVVQGLRKAGSSLAKNAKEYGSKAAKSIINNLSKGMEKASPVLKRGLGEAKRSLTKFGNQAYSTIKSMTFNSPKKVNGANVKRGQDWVKSQTHKADSFMDEMVRKHMAMKNNKTPERQKKEKKFETFEEIEKRNIEENRKRRERERKAKIREYGDPNSEEYKNRKQREYDDWMTRH